MNNQKLYLSNSSISMFNSCKRKFKYKYIDKIKSSHKISNKYLSFGQSIHKTLAKYNMISDKKLRTLSNLHNLLRNNWIREGYSNRDEERDFGLKALKILTNYFYNPLDNGNKTLLTEKMIYKDMGDFILCGVIDKGFIRNDNKLEITDYKTGDTIVHSDDFHIDIQLPIYVLLSEKFFGKPPSIVSYYYLSHNKKIEREITDENIEEIESFLWDTFKDINSEKDFECSPNQYCLTSCEFSDICDRSTDEKAIIAKELEMIKDINMSELLF